MYKTTEFFEQTFEKTILFNKTNFMKIDSFLLNKRFYWMNNLIERNLENKQNRWKLTTFWKRTHQSVVCTWNWYLEYHCVYLKLIPWILCTVCTWHWYLEYHCVYLTLIPWIPLCVPDTDTLDTFVCIWHWYLGYLCVYLTLIPWIPLCVLETDTLNTTVCTWHWYLEYHCVYLTLIPWIPLCVSDTDTLNTTVCIYH